MAIDVSVIIPAHNSAHYLPEALDSVLVQGVDSLEIILVDDGSEDNTPELAARHVQKSGAEKFIYVRQYKCGPAAARNAGLLRARGRFIAFLDADDTWIDGSLKKRLDYLREHPETGMVCADGSNVGTEGVIDASYFRSRRTYAAFAAGGFVFDDLFNYLVDITMVLTPTVVLRRECLDAVGNFDETLSVGEDKELWFRIGRRFRIVALPEVMLLRRIHGSNISHGEIVRRVSYAAIGEKIRRTDPGYYKEHRAQFDHWLATMHHELGYWRFQEGKFFAAMAEQAASLRHEFRLKSLFDFAASLFVALTGRRIFKLLRSLKRVVLFLPLGLLVRDFSF